MNIKIPKIQELRLVKSMAVSVLCQPISAIIGLIYTPLLLAYLGNEKYGVWSTILSIISWINYFDVGIGNGLRNMLTRDIAQNDYRSAQKSVSTAYVAISAISIVSLVGALIIGSFFDWNVVLGSNLNVEPALVISYIFICINFVLQLSNIQCHAIQKTEIVPIVGIVIQLINLSGIIVLDKLGGDELVQLAILFGMSSFIVRLSLSGAIWRKRRYLVPQFRCFDRLRLKNICNLGVGFFLIQISALVLFSTDSLIVSYLYGAESVTPYNTVYGVFNMIYAAFAAAMAPLWGRFTVAKEQNEFAHIRKMVINTKYLLIPLALGTIFLGLIYEDFAYIWLGKQLDYPVGLVACMAIYTISNMYAAIYSTVFNGLGIIRLQTIQAVCMAIINIPLSIFFARDCGMGSTGVCLATALGSIIGNVVFTFYFSRIIGRKI